MGGDINETKLNTLIIVEAGRWVCGWSFTVPVSLHLCLNFSIIKDFPKSTMKVVAWFWRSFLQCESYPGIITHRHLSLP